MNVRKYREKDKESVRHICHETATAKKYIENPRLVTALYADYYIEREPDNCFVLVDEFDKAVGYTLCAEAFEAYEQNFRPYLKTASGFGASVVLAHKLEAFATRALRREYPAHLHIDILPAFQGQGGGRGLITTLCGHLRGKGVPGVMLTVGAGNKNAIAFYEKLGFKKAKTLPGAYVFVKRLTDGKPQNDGNAR